MKKKSKSSKKSTQAKHVEDAELTPSQRAILANRIRLQMLTLETDGLVLENMEGIKKLKIMLSLFEKAGKEFETYVSLKEFDDRYLEVRLRTNRNRPSVVIIRHGAIPGSITETHETPEPVKDDNRNNELEEDLEDEKDDEEIPDLIETQVN